MEKNKIEEFVQTAEKILSQTVMSEKDIIDLEAKMDEFLVQKKESSTKEHKFFKRLI